ncbi:MAG: efflux transporter outer membrane subunit [Deltaproteobacteria bacterium]|jgi:multidrug efflux system outer membrane protein
MRRAVLAMTATLSGCAWLHPVDHERPAPVIVPEQFSGGTATSSVAEGRWWSAFGDDALDDLEKRAFSHNLDLRRAFLRLERAMAVSDGANAAWWPTLDASGNISHSQRAFPTGRNPDGSPIFGIVEQNSGQLQLAAGYELDVFGRIKSQTSAADFDVLASRYDVDAMAMSISAQVAEAWYQLVEQRAVLQLIDAQVEANDTYLELTEARFGEGLATALDVLQQRQQVAGAKAQRPLVQARIQTLENQLAVLLGAPPKQVELAGQDAFPELPPLPGIGVPAELVRRRPDVRAAEARVVAADYRVGAAIAARFPALRLDGSLGLQIFSIATFFDGIIRSLTASLLAPIFDGGRRAADVDAAEATLEDAVTAYGQTVLVAFQEVEDALAREKRQREYLVEIDRQADAAKKTLDEALNRYLAGLTEYLQVLTALRQFQQVEQQQLSAQRQLISYRIQLCRSLGGSWMRELERPELLSAADESTETKAKP